MKRMVIAIALIMIATPAMAVSDLDVMVYGHNINTAICGAQELKGDPVIDAENGAATFNLTDKLTDIFFIKNDEVSGFGCVCRDSSQEIEFLAQCVTACYNFAGNQAGETCYDAILSQFMFARAGNPLGESAQVPGILFQIKKESYGYVFMLVKVK